MRTLWTNFAKYHNPNGDVASSEGPWLPTTTEVLSVYRIDSNPAMEEWTEPEKCDFWIALDNGAFMSACQDKWWVDAPNYNDSCSECTS
jgi:hypothetical protein